MKRQIYSVLLLFLFVIAPSAWAGPKDEVAAATAKWAELFTDDNPDTILVLYDKDAVLWGTLSPKRRDNPEAVRDYFVKAYVALPSHKVSFGDQLIRVYGNIAINTGYYTFTYVKDGEAKSLPSRYSIVYMKKGKKWLIVDHHSSVMPTPLK